MNLLEFLFMNQRVPISPRAAGRISRTDYPSCDTRTFSRNSRGIAVPQPQFLAISVKTPDTPSVHYIHGVFLIPIINIQMGNSMTVLVRDLDRPRSKPLGTNHNGDVVDEDASEAGPGG